MRSWRWRWVESGREEDRGGGAREGTLEHLIVSLNLVCFSPASAHMSPSQKIDMQMLRD